MTTEAPAAAAAAMPPSLLAAAPAAPAAETAPQDPALAAKAAKAERPEWLPEQFWDPDKASPKVDALAKSWGDMRALVSKGGHKPPADPDAYEVPMPEGSTVQVAKDDPVWGAFRKAAHQEGLSADTVKRLMAPVMAEIAKAAGSVQAPPGPEQVAAQQAAFLAEERSKLGNQAEALTSMLGSWVNGMVSRGVLTAEEAAEVAVLGQTAAGVRALAKLREASGERSIPLDPAAGSSDSAGLAEYYRLVGSEAWRKGDVEVRRKAADLLTSLAKRGMVPDRPPERFGLV